MLFQLTNVQIIFKMCTFAINSFQLLFDKFFSMKDKTKNIFDQSILLSILFICLSIYLPPLFKSLSITILALVLIASFVSKTHSPKPNLKKSFLLPILFYALHIIGTFYSSDKNEALFDLQIKLPILILPILFLFLPSKFLTKDYLFKYSIAIIGGCIIYILYSFGSGIISSITNSLPLIPEISYGKLTSQPSYFALIASIALILNDRLPLQELFNINSNVSNIIKVIIVLIISTFFLFLNSTSGLFCISFAYLYIIIHNYVVEKKKWVTLLNIILVLIFYVMVFNIDTLNSRYKYYANVELKTEKKDGSQRKFIILNAPKIIVQSSLFGSGTGDTKPIINKLYKDNGINFYMYFNAHNQFLQTNIALGIIGLIILILMFILPIIKIVNNKEYYLLTIYLIIGFSFLFESMLDRSMGAYFFAIMYVLTNTYIENKTKSLSYLNL